MKYRVLFASLLVALGACGSSKKDSDQAEMPSAGRPQVGVVETLFEVVDEKGRQRIGFVEKTSYDSGRIVFWVYGPKYREKQGYLLPNNRAYKYDWHAGERTPSETEFAADTMNSNVRRVLEYTDSIVMVQVDQAAIANELLKKRYAKPAQTAEAAGCGCGCGE